MLGFPPLRHAGFKFRKKRSVADLYFKGDTHRQIETTWRAHNSALFS